MTPARTRLLVGLFLALGAAFLLHLAVGGYLWLAPRELVAELLRGPDPEGGPANVVIWNVRLPRALGCVLVGATLGAVGAAFQALFRNPLAEPYVIGVSSGAAVGGVASILLGFSGALAGLGKTLAAFVTGVASLALVMALARCRGVVHVQSLLIAGVVSGSLFAALTTLLLFLAGQDANRVLRWLLGSTSELRDRQLALLALALVLGFGLLIRRARALNAFAIGEETAQRLGVPTSRLKTVVLGAGTAMVATTVGAAGIIGFLGLVAPHLARRLLGADVRLALLGSLSLGASLLLAADVLAQRVGGVAELPVGAVTALLGAPALLALLRRRP